jgi:HD superfamily phosphodiesterase
MKISRLKNFLIHKIQTEASPQLTYHGAHHTLEVLNVCNQYIKRCSVGTEDAYLLRTAALLHDIGILWDYHNHEEQGILFVRQLLPQWGYLTMQIDIICNMIKATKIPQTPHTLLEMILCDADVDYLGTDKFYEIGFTLFEELKEFSSISDEESWDRVQVNFLNQHRYHTSFGKKYREPIKRKYLSEIIAKRNWASEYL